MLYDVEVVAMRRKMQGQSDDLQRAAADHIHNVLWGDGDYQTEAKYKAKVDAAIAGRRTPPRRGLEIDYCAIVGDLSSYHDAMERFCYRNSCRSIGRKCADGSHCHRLCLKYLNFCHEKRAEKQRAASELRTKIEAYYRLADPERSADLCIALTGENLSSFQFQVFLDAAVRSSQSFEGYRRLKADAEAIKAQIVASMAQLEDLIAKFRATGVRLPIRLRQRWDTDEPWPRSDDNMIAELQVKRFVEDGFDRGMRSYKGEPESIDLLKELGQAKAELIEWPIDLGLPSATAATVTRQNSRKSASIRAFAAELREAKIALGSPIYRAIAFAMNLVADDASDAVSEDDVRKAVTRSGKPPTNRAVVPKRNVRKTRRGSKA